MTFALWVQVFPFFSPHTVMPTYEGSGGTVRYTKTFFGPTAPTGYVPKKGIPAGHLVISRGKDGPKPMTLKEHAEHIKALKRDSDLDAAANANLIHSTHDVVQNHLAEERVDKAGKRRRSPSPEEPYPPPKRNRRGGRRGNSKRSTTTKVDVRELRYSQLSCKQTFSCGRKVSELVRDLLDRKVRLSAPFLRLTVFEDVDEETNEPILKSCDNRRLYALKEYAKKSGHDSVLVNVDVFNRRTVSEVERILRNSDDTNGRDVRLRQNHAKKHKSRK